MPSIATVPWLGVLFAALAVRAQRVTRRVRSEAAQVLREGALRMAYVADVRQEQLGRTPANAGLALHVAAAATKKHRYTIRFNIDGESVTMVTTNDGLSLLPVGTQIEVLYRPGSDHVVPTYLLM
jgi:hypothetical protein